MAKCDLCGETCPADKMTQLRPCYAVDGVQDLCPKCTSWANKRVAAHQGEVLSNTRNDITRYHQKKQAPRSHMGWPKELGLWLLVIASLLLVLWNAGVR